MNVPTLTHKHTYTHRAATFVGFVSHTNRLVGVPMTSVGSGALMFVFSYVCE